MSRRTINHYSFYYNDSEEKPYLKPKSNKKNKNIKGVEFEVNDNDRDNTNRLIDKLINKKQICSKDTQDEYKRKLINATLSYDNTVHHEIVLQADMHRNIMRKIKALNEFLNPKTILNSDGTSMHVHMNKEYLRNQGLRDIDIVKAGESISHVLYNISGRFSNEEIRRWVQTRVAQPLDTPIILRSKYIDEIELHSVPDYDSHGDGHYKMVNVSNAPTVELRIFSNIHNFDYNHSKICLELVDVVIDIAKEMQGVLYSNNYHIPIDIVEDFFNKNKRRQKYYDKIKYALIQTPSELESFEKVRMHNKIKRKYDNILRQSGISGVLRELRNDGITYNQMVNLARLNDSIDDITQYIVEETYNQIL